MLNLSTILDSLRKEIPGKINNYMVSYFCERMDCYVYVGVNLAPKLEESKNKEETNIDKDIINARDATERVADMLIAADRTNDMEQNEQ